MCFLRKDFVAGWCLFCKTVSAQMYRQKLCWDSCEGYDRHTSGWYNDPQTERYAYHEGLLPTDSCLWPREGRDPVYAFWGDPPLQFRKPLVLVPDKEYWGFNHQIPQEQQRGWDKNAPCIRCDPVYGELNWWWFCSVLVERNRLVEWPGNYLSRYVEGCHQSNPHRLADPTGKLGLLQLRKAFVPFAPVMMVRKPRSYKPSDEFLHGFPHEPRDARDVAKEMRFERLDRLQDRLLAEGRNLFEGRCAGRTDEEGEYGVEEKVPAAEDIDQEIAFMHGVDYDHTEEEFDEILDNNHRQAHRWDHGGPFWDVDGSAVLIPPQVDSDELEHGDTYSDYDPDNYTDGLGDSPHEDLTAQIASVQLASRENDRDGEYVDPGVDESYVVHQRQPYGDDGDQDAIEYHGYHPGDRTDKGCYHSDASW